MYSKMFSYSISVGFSLLLFYKGLSVRFHHTECTFCQTVIESFNFYVYGKRILEVISIKECLFEDVHVLLQMGP